jgi:N-acetylmuramoyl-L-alanine amidase
VSKKLIALDAGHGMKTEGKRCLKSIDPAQTREWQLNDRIADMVGGRLAAYDCQLLRVDDTTGVKDISLAARVKAANNSNADIYVSIHHNAGINGGTGGGTVVYYYSGDPVREKQAKRLYDLIVCRTQLRGNRSSKVIKKGFYVIKNTKMPAFLIENGFMDSKTDVPIILTEAHAEKTAKGIVEFLVDTLKLSKKNTGTSEVQSSAYYPAYTGKKTTLSAALTSLGINSTYAFRKQIAVVNSITGYTGTATQNTRMYNLLVAGLLLKA